MKLIFSVIACLTLSLALAQDNQPTITETNIENQAPQSEKFAPVVQSTIDLLAPEHMSVNTENVETLSQAPKVLNTAE